MVGHLFQNCRFKAYKSRLYRLDGQQNRFDLYHVRLDHPRWSALTWFVPDSTRSSTVEKTDPIPPHCVKKMRLDPAQVDARIS